MDRVKSYLCIFHRDYSAKFGMANALAMMPYRISNGGNLTTKSCIRPYHVENTSSRPITEVKQHWAALVLGWVTAWEYAVLYSFYFIY